MINLPDGWFHPGDIKIYRSLAEQVPDGGSIVELGVWKGRSLCSIADIIKKKRLKVYAVDTFKGSTNETEEHKEAKEIDLKQVFLDNMNQFGLKPEVYAMTTNDAALKLNKQFDLIFIDAEHTYDGITQDIKNWLPKCKGIIAGHDYEIDDIFDVVNKNFPNVNYIHSPNDEDRGTLWWNDCRKGNTVEKKIDVIIPAYNAQNTIERTLGSIVMQSIVDKLTVTIVNDGDEVDYKKFVNQFSDFMNIREIKLKENGGPGVARQFGIDNTSSPYFTCIDADDTFAGPFSLELLLKSAESNPEYHTFVGSFAEQHPGLSFLNHQNDLIWMFGKMYRREFIDKYNVRFNDTRANEDNGFNTLIRLISSDTEKIMFLPDIVYYWHHKEDSITRINKAQYSYDQSFVGYVDNMIYAIKTAKKIKPFNNYIDMWAIQTMAHLYLYYYQTIKRDPRFIEQNYLSCIKYYKEIFASLYEKAPAEKFIPIFAETIAGQSSSMMDIIPDKTIYQFIEELRNQ